MPHFGYVSKLLCVIIYELCTKQLNLDILSPPYLHVQQEDGKSFWPINTWKINSYLSEFENHGKFSVHRAHDQFYPLKALWQETFCDDVHVYRGK